MKQIDADAYLREVGLKPFDCDRLAATLLRAKDEYLSAYIIASVYRLGHVEKAARLLAAVGNWPRMLRLIADELEGKRKRLMTDYDPTPTGQNIMSAYGATAGAFSRVPPTLAEVKEQWKTLFGKLPLSDRLYDSPLVEAAGVATES